MKRLLFVLVVALPSAAQQQVVPDDFNRKQEKLFVELTQAVSTPCCTNGIPVAFHDSGMANHVREQIIAWIREGREEDQIREDLLAMRFGPNNDMPLIFTEPDNSWISILTWLVAPVVLVAGFLVVFLLVLRKRDARTSLSEDELVENYRDAIMAKAQGKA